MQKTDKEFVIKLADFGFSCSAKQIDKTVLVGSPHYIAPEAILQKKQDQKVDVWALGVILYMCLTGKQPFYGSDARESFVSILNTEPDYSALSAFWNGGIVADLVQKCLAKDPEQRPSIE